MPALPAIATAFVGGTFAAALMGGGWWLTVLVAALASWATAAWSRSRISLLVLLALVTFAAAGHARFESSHDTAPSELATLQGPHEVVGTIREEPHFRGITARVDLDVESIDGNGASGGLRLTLPAPRTALRAGDRLLFAGEIERPPEIEDFDYAAYLRSRGIDAVAAYPPRWEVTGHEDSHWVAARLQALRRHATSNIERVLPEPEASLATGLLLGAQRTMPQQLADDLRVTGTTHLVVVSGQNIALVMALGVAILAACMNRRHAAVLALILLPGYVLLIGADPPVVRAAIMAVGLTAADVTGRRTPAWIFLAYAAAIMLALEPGLALDVSFQLSLTATAGVLLIAPPLRDWLLARIGPRGSHLNTVIEVAAVSAAAALAVLPVQAAAFESLPLMQVPANVVIAPVYEVTLLASIAAATLGWIGPLAEPLGVALRVAPAIFIRVIGVLGDVPATVIEVRAPLTAGVVWYAALACGLWWLYRRQPAGLSPGADGRLAPTFLLALAVGSLWVAIARPADDLVTVTVLDVGQGLAVLVQDEHSAVLVDTGPPDGAVLAALSRAGLTSHIDAVILTHDDLDHTGGLPLVEDRFIVDRVFAAAAVEVERAEAIRDGDRIRLTDRTAIEVVWPSRTAAATDLSDNDRSLVLLVTAGDRRILLPADIEAGAEEHLLSDDKDIQADVLIVPHHGSKTSSTPAFLDAVHPRFAVISVGAENPYGHPAPEVLARYADITLFRTDEHGEISVHTDGVTLSVQPARTPRDESARGRTATAGATVPTTPISR